jgi:hypothetical protein
MLRPALPALNTLIVVVVDDAAAADDADTRGRAMPHAPNPKSARGNPRRRPQALGPAPCCKTQAGPPPE